MRRLDMSKLSEEAIAEQMEQVNNWTRQGDAISKTFTFSTFPEAISFVSDVASQAEAAEHHPDIDIRYNKVTLTLSTHDAGGLTKKDFNMATALDKIV
jgi:4a-hydroxytetrahydrobiopterin dehydratase